LHEWWPKATQGGPSDSSPLRSDGSRDGLAGRLCVSETKDTQSKLNLTGDNQAQVHSDQMVPVVVRQGGWTAGVVAKGAQMKVGK
jgi:hypothetical protein